MLSNSPNTCFMFLVRHGATALNRANPPLLQGRRRDHELSKEGLWQARKTSKLLSDFKINKVYSSPLLRARQTADEIAKPYQLDVQIVEDLVEVDVGNWEGKSWADIERSTPEAYQAFMSDASVAPYHGGENLLTVKRRAVPALESLMAENVGQRIAVVAHNVVNRCYLTKLLGLPLRQYRSVPQDNCGLNVTRYRNGTVKLLVVNAILHLDGQ